METTIKTLRADDHKVLRDGLRALPDGEGDLKVAAEAGAAEEAVSLASRLIADVVVMDLGMPGGGLNTIRTVRASERPC